MPSRSGRWSSAGTGARPSIIRELDAYVPPGSEIMVVASSAGDRAPRFDGSKPPLKAQRIVHRLGDSTDRATLDALGVERFDHIIVLCYSDTLDASSGPTPGRW